MDNIKKENNLEKSARNKNDSPYFLVIGAIAEAIMPGTGALSFLGAGVLTTYVCKPLIDPLNDYKTPLRDMPLYAIKNSARCLIGATVVSGLKYLI